MKFFYNEIRSFRNRTCDETMTEKKIVEIKNLTKTYGTRGFQTKVLKGIDLMIFQHDFIAIMGPQRIWEDYFAEYSFHH